MNSVTPPSVVKVTSSSGWWARCHTPLPASGGRRQYSGGGHSREGRTPRRGGGRGRGGRTDMVEGEEVLQVNRWIVWEETIRQQKFMLMDGVLFNFTYLLCLSWFTGSLIGSDMPHRP